MLVRAGHCDKRFEEWMRNQVLAVAECRFGGSADFALARNTMNTQPGLYANFGVIPVAAVRSLSLVPLDPQCPSAFVSDDTFRTCNRRPPPPDSPGQFLERRACATVCASKRKGHRNDHRLIAVRRGSGLPRWATPCFLSDRGVDSCTCQPFCVLPATVLLLESRESRATACPYRAGGTVREVLAVAGFARGCPGVP